jgi:excisionase family DNA binding protein
MPPDQISPYALRIPQACRFSGKGRTSLYGAIKRGELRAVKCGRSTLILVEDLKVWLNRLPAITVNRGI